MNPPKIVLVVLLCWLPGLSPADESGSLVPAVGSDSVFVELCESGIPAENRWPEAAPSASETYQERAMAFFRIPRKYNREGVREDRANPLLLRATTTVQLDPGRYQILLRSRRAARLWLQHELIAENGFPAKISDGHDPVQRPFIRLPGRVRFAAPGDQEALVTFESDGGEHVFKLEVFVGGFVGNTTLRPELGETLVGISREGEEGFWILSPQSRLPLTDQGWREFKTERSTYYAEVDAHQLRLAQQLEEAYWMRRHEYSRQVALAHDSSVAEHPRLNSIDDILSTAGVIDFPAQFDRSAEHSFLRRVYLDTVGVVPTLDEIKAYFQQHPASRRNAVVDQLLDDPRWADHWVGYWQDVLGENPSIVNPTLNNTGPFRWWIHESFQQNKPFDRFATELVMMSGSMRDGGPAGFSMATENDVPMAAKANILAAAFLGVQLKCSRCHDAPYHSNTQRDLFSLAAMLARTPLAVPPTSSVPIEKLRAGGREPMISVSLEPGSEVPPAWSFPDLSPTALPEAFRRADEDSRWEFAWRLTSPHNRRFAAVIANRVWRRLIGEGIVEPVNDWERATPGQAGLLEFLASELQAHDYDLKHLSRLILKSALYQRESPATGHNLSIARPYRRRMTAEQLVDSLFVAFGKELRTEELNIDITAGRPWRNALNLGRPTRAWHFGGMATNRDRPSLTLPRAQAIIDVLGAFGWRSSRQEPASYRPDEPNVLQPAMLANGTMSRWLTTLSDDHEITDLALAEQPLSALIRTLFLRVLTREPRDDEAAQFEQLLAAGYSTRAAANGKSDEQPPIENSESNPPLFVTWANHLEPAATTIKLREAEAARRGDPATNKLDPVWRTRLEDVLWVLLNLPETIHYR